MRRSIALLFLVLFSQNVLVQGQYNHTFSHTINGNPELVAPVDIIDGGNNTTVTIGHSWGNVYLVLRKLDFNGNALVERAYELRDYIPNRIIKTFNNEYIAVGQVGRTNEIFAIRFDINLNIIWSTRYADNTGYPVNFYAGIKEMVNIVKVNNSTDDYIIVGAGGTAYSPTGAYPFTAISALRIFGANGLVIWDKKYYSPLAAFAYNPATPGLMFIRRESPTALAYGDNRYFIGGVALATYYTSAGVMGPYDVKYTNFAMTINDNGAIVDAYKEFTVPGSPKAPGAYSFHDALFDMQTQQFVMSFTINNFPLSNAFNKTEIGVIKFSSSLGFSDFRYYFSSDKPDHYAYRIKETYANDGYIIASGVNSSIPTSQAFVPALLKLYKNGNVDFYHRYNENQSFNINNNFLGNPAITPVMDAGGLENYAMSSSPVHTRVISTDIFGSACGENGNFYDYVASDLSFYPPVSYVRASHVVKTPILASPLPVMTVQMTDCLNHPNPYNYRTTDITDRTTSMVDIYPTLLAPGNNTVTIATNTEAAGNLTLSLTGMDGRIVETKSLSVDKGNNITSYTLGVSTPGIYVLRVTSGNSSLNQTVKICKQ
ncbi:MAG TPA: T9SS type A sorting domain-containing protein [Chitinophagaceae bacterium]|nr:T9SS type A sorting domain-containing protein [Chitinophagaceae bacterium]